MVVDVGFDGYQPVDCFGLVFGCAVCHYAAAVVFDCETYGGVGGGEVDGGKEFDDLQPYGVGGQGSDDALTMIVEVLELAVGVTECFDIIGHSSLNFF